MWNRVPILVSALLLAAPAHATIDLVTDSPLLLGAGQSGGAVMLLSVENSDPTPPPTDNLTGWQVTLIVIPDAGATGTVGFFSAALPAAGYILAGINLGLTSAISTTTTTDDSLLAFDVNFPFSGGALVPVAPGAGLLDLQYTSSGDASGTFGVFALGGLAVSEWSDNASGGPMAREYGNIAGSGNTRIGEIRIPEPRTSLQLVAACLFGAVFRRRCRRPSPGP